MLFMCANENEIETSEERLQTNLRTIIKCFNNNFYQK